LKKLYQNRAFKKPFTKTKLLKTKLSPKLLKHFLIKLFLKVYMK